LLAVVEPLVRLLFLRCALVGFYMPNRHA
jgi:hypothetical protein